MTILFLHPTRKVYLDLDGVMADFYGVAARILGRSYRDMPSAQAWPVLDQVDSYFLNLPRLPDALDLWQGVQGAGELHILTALPKLTNKLVSAPADKRAWVRANIDASVPVILAENGPAKAKFARPGDILIDDTPRNIDAWVAAGGLGILHTSAADSLAQLKELQET